jgi:hypothetical protein
MKWRLYLECDTAENTRTTIVFPQDGGTWFHPRKVKPETWSTTLTRTKLLASKVSVLLPEKHANVSVSSLKILPVREAGLITGLNISSKELTSCAAENGEI